MDGVVLRLHPHWTRKRKCKAAVVNGRCSHWTQVTSKPKCVLNSSADWASSPVHTGWRARRNNAYANYGTHSSQWCSHSLQATSKDLHANLYANVLPRPV